MKPLLVFWLDLTTWLDPRIQGCMYVHVEVYSMCLSVGPPPPTLAQDCTLGEILDEDDVIQECKTQNKKLVEL